jgi:hypothetical protein
MGVESPHGDHAPVTPAAKAAIDRNAVSGTVVPRSLVGRAVIAPQDGELAALAAPEDAEGRARRSPNNSHPSKPERRRKWNTARPG